MNLKSSINKTLLLHTVSAAVKFIPRPPALVLSKNTNISDLNKNINFQLQGSKSFLEGILKNT